MVDQPPFRREAVAAPVYISWGAVIAGAIAASALTFVLITFGAAIGLAVASPSATWRLSSARASLTRLACSSARMCCGGAGAIADVPIEPPRFLQEF